MSTRIFAATAALFFCAGLLAAAEPATQPATQPSAADLLDQLLQPPAAGTLELAPAPNPPRIDASTGLRALAPHAPALPLHREGSFVVDRVGRLQRDADGRLEFAFDSDGSAMRDPPMLLLPNLKLAAMEDAEHNATHDLRFHVSGMVTVYQGRNYLLVEKGSAIPDADYRY